MTEIVLYTREEVSKNNGKANKDIWVIIDKSIYDVTNYMSEHPGGPELIEEYAGKDATSAFFDVGHSTEAKKQLKKMKIGEVHPDERNGGNKSTPKVNEDSESTSAHRRNFLDILSCGICGRKSQ
ncbi:cytochrome b5-like [Coccinella septempunctata]|uniref:cytochrome b5-like n=1 Tax=Coccinella septempunctata TaxID=41139 RepID=UPI001D0937C4|nr:cytochrome b5-like [Coccinella septempunctata]